MSIQIENIALYMSVGCMDGQNDGQVIQLPVLDAPGGPLRPGA